MLIHLYKAGAGVIVGLILVAAAGPESQGPEDDVKAAFRSFQQNLRWGMLEEAWTMLGDGIRERIGSREEFIRRTRENPGKFKPVVALKVLRVKVKKDRAVIVTDSPMFALRTLEFKRYQGRWRLESFASRRSVYPEGREKAFAAATARFADLCVLRERLRFLKNILMRRAYYGADRSADSEARFTLLAALLADSKALVLKRRAELRALLKKPPAGALAITAKLEEDLIHLQSELEPRFTWARRQGIWLPGQPEPLAIDAAAGDRLRFGVMVRYFNYEAFPAWRILGFDFLCCDIGWGPAYVPWQDGEPDFGRIRGFVKANAEFGFKTDLGQAGLGPVDFCLWHRGERQKWKKYFRKLGELFRGDPFVLCYEIFNEPDNRPFDQERGRNRQYAEDAFRAYLRNRYGTVRALNKSWGTEFPDFGQIHEPGRGVHFGPPQRDFHRFLQESLAEFLDICLKTLKKHDPNHPVLTQITEFGGKQDAFLIGGKSADFFSLHMTFGGPPGGANNMAKAASFARFLGKPLWQEEFIFNWPEAVNTEEIDELSAAIHRNIWQALGWGFRSLQFFELDNQWGDWQNSVLDRQGGYGVIRPESARIAVAISLARRLEKVIAGTELAQAEVGIVDSPGTRLVPMAGKRHLGSSDHLEKFLFHEGWSYTVLPEAGLASRPERWSGLKVVVLPECEYLDPSAAKALEQYVADGGTLVQIARGGALDSAGGPTALGRLLSREREAGKGRIVRVGRDELARVVLRDELHRTLGLPRVKVEPAGQTQSFLREGASGKYLFLVNLSAREEITAEVSLKGKFATAADLVTQSPVPVEQTDGRSWLSTRIEPGGVAVLRLKED